jgi:hypothetical protein
MLLYMKIIMSIEQLVYAKNCNIVCCQRCNVLHCDEMY